MISLLILMLVCPLLITNSGYIINILKDSKKFPFLFIFLAGYMIIDPYRADSCFCRNSVNLVDLKWYKLL